MQKNNSRGFVLAETLIVTVFLMVIFSMLYSNFYPLIGEYEKRETYDDVDSKYAVYWLKKLVEDGAYSPNPPTPKYGFIRFKCSDMTEPDKIVMCRKLVKSLEVSGCDDQGNNCDIFITNYTIGNDNNPANYFKTHVLARHKKYEETCSNSACVINHKNSCKGSGDEICANIFDSGLEEYIATLPDYTRASEAHHRVIASFHHKKDNNNYYSYSTIEVNR